MIDFDKMIEAAAIAIRTQKLEDENLHCVHDTKANSLKLAEAALRAAFKELPDVIHKGTPTDFHEMYRIATESYLKAHELYQELKEWADKQTQTEQE